MKTGTTSEEHVDNNLAVRKMLKERSVLPELMPAAGNVKKIQRKLNSEEKKTVQELKKGTANNIHTTVL